MDVIVLIVSFAALFLFVLIKETVDARKMKKNFMESLKRDYGKPLVKKYSPERYERIKGYYKKHVHEGMIDDITWNDLNLDEIFKQINYTFSATGEEYLYYTLRKNDKKREELEHLEEIISYFKTNVDERIRFQCLMKELGYTGKFSLYDYIDNLDYLGERSNKKHIICNLLFLPLIGLLPFCFAPAMVAIVLLAAFNIISYFKEKNEIDPYITSFAYVLRIVDACKRLLDEDVPVCSLELGKIRKHYLVLKKMQTGSFIVFSSNKQISSGNPLEIVFDYLRMIFHLDLIRFNRMLSYLREHLNDVDELITQLGYLEMAIAVGAFRQSLPEYCLPEFTDREFLITDAYHPLIPDAVRNSVSTEKGVLITGSNASGKSTFLKMTALNVILAQTIHTCTAKKYKAPLYQIYSSMSLRDDLLNGESYYIVEIKALKRIVDAASKGERIICFVDEVLRGTNTVERISASTQILKSLSGKGILCFAATHDIELTELLKHSYDNYHFEEEIKDGDVVFHYQLLPGKATTRNAIKLLRLMGFEQGIIDDAIRQSELFAENGFWTLPEA